MFAFVGYIVHANGIKFPWPMQLDGTPFPTVSSAPEAWDSISDAAKWQIFAFIGFLEFVSSKHDLFLLLMMLLLLLLLLESMSSRRLIFLSSHLRYFLLIRIDCITKSTVP
jgi:uncharacterized membrane protein